MLVSKMPILTSLNTLYNNTNINTKYSCQNTQSYMCACPLPKKNINTINYFQTTDSYLCTLYNNTYINIKVWCQNAQSYMFTYTLRQHKYEQKLLLPNFLLLQVYMPSTTTKRYT